MDIPVDDEPGIYREVTWRSHDDLTLSARIYGSASAFRPVVCLAGLTRNARDFHDLAVMLSSDPRRPRRVYCLDYRGRGKSDWDPKWQNYSPSVELLDVDVFLTIQGLTDVALIGTSRGGIIGMLLAIMRPAALGCLVLNDIGPVIETAGLARIMGYAGKIPVPRNWQEARQVVRDINKRQFPAVDEAGWEKLARQWFNEIDGKPAAAYDPKIGAALSEVDISRPMPDMWPYFDALQSMPVMVLRGENSDLLSAATVQEMQNRHPGLVSRLVRDEGHAPLLNDVYTQNQIADFLASSDGG